MIIDFLFVYVIPRYPQLFYIQRWREHILLPKSRNFFICLAQSRPVLRKIENILLRQLFIPIFPDLLLFSRSYQLTGAPSFDFNEAFLALTVCFFSFSPVPYLQNTFKWPTLATDIVHLIIKCNWFVNNICFGQSSGQIGLSKVAVSAKW